MRELSIDQLHILRACAFENATGLIQEASLLLKHDRYARAYLLSHLACEEMGKISMIAGVIGTLLIRNDPMLGRYLTCVLSHPSSSQIITELLEHENIDWNACNQRFLSHQEKIDASDLFHYAFGLPSDPEKGSDAEWLKTARQSTKQRIKKKNNSTYVGAKGKKILVPHESISRDDAEKMIHEAIRALHLHFQTEQETNPLFLSHIEEHFDDLKGFPFNLFDSDE